MKKPLCCILTAKGLFVWYGATPYQASLGPDAVIALFLALGEELRARQELLARGLASGPAGARLHLAFTTLWALVTGRDAVEGDLFGGRSSLFNGLAADVLEDGLAGGLLAAEEPAKLSLDVG